jgi:hypothetical protein
MSIQRSVIATGLAAVMLMAAIPIYQSEFMQSRMVSASADLGARQAQWNDALAIQDPGWGTTLFGMGIGRFPETTYWRSTLYPRAGQYQLANEKDNTYLRLGSGDTIGVEQLVSLMPGQTYVLTMDVRPSRPNTKIAIPICEKWLLTSGNCLSLSFDLGKESGNWHSVEERFTNTELVDHPWYAPRPVKLALTYDATQSTIDVDNVKLQTEQGHDLIQNGDFSQGLDHWFFAAESTLHAHWRIHSLFYGALFDQGWFGLLALGIVLVFAIVRSARKGLQGDAISGASCAALSGILAGGFFDTPIDTPRIVMLLLMLTLTRF